MHPATKVSVVCIDGGEHNRRQVKGLSLMQHSPLSVVCFCGLPLRLHHRVCQYSACLRSKNAKNASGRGWRAGAPKGGLIPDDCRLTP